MLASIVPEVDNACEVLFNELDTRWHDKQVDRAALVNTDGRTLEPPLCLFLRAAYVRGPGQDFGKLPSPPLLLLAQRGTPRGSLGSMSSMAVHS